MKKIAVGLSGGVDSCTAAYLLREQGYEAFYLAAGAWKSAPVGCA